MQGGEVKHRALPQVLLGGLIAFGAATHAAESMCLARPLGHISVATLEDVPFVTLEANQRPMIMLLDTGAERTALTLSAAARIKAQPPRVVFDRRMYGFGGNLPTREVEFDSLSADGVSIPWRRALVAQVTLAQPLGIELDGLLGADVLSQFDSDLDLAHQQLTLYQKHSCPNGPPWAMPYTTFDTGFSRGEHLFFQVRLDNSEMTAIIDTGTQRTTISAAAAYQVGISTTALEHDQQLTTRGAAGERVLAQVHHFSSLQIGSEVVRDPELVVTNTTFPDADVILGADFLKTQRIWLSYSPPQVFLGRR